jgi:hypothetical protein
MKIRLSDKNIYPTKSISEVALKEFLDISDALVRSGDKIEILE